LDRPIWSVGENPNKFNVQLLLKAGADIHKPGDERNYDILEIMRPI
jgi:hypothetical protein